MSGMPSPVRGPGRPRRPDVEQRVLDAAIQLLAERGVDAATMNEVVARSGVARATVYLRWPTRQALITAAVRRAMGQPVLEPSGDVMADLRRAAEQIRLVLSSPEFRGIFPALVAGLTRTGLEQLSFDLVAPGCRLFAAEYDELAARQGLRGDISGETAVNVILGAAIAHYLITGTAPTKAVEDQAIEVALKGLQGEAVRR